ncbi:hypothetical protein [Rhodococcoides corynebacterioides]|uniref:hypothetical protein n=1 Tax=Rhodococcoides corynebacterioides TaxID=53972 RepID=UPI001C9A68C3|nr:hypothetical protein [Rhodococcus corynebacterioides]MBY6365087.1 hypothetical protein [Rhodococcus corynebacterioides]
MIGDGSLPYEGGPATAALWGAITVGAWFVHAAGADDDPTPDSRAEGSAESVQGELA